MSLSFWILFDIDKGAGTKTQLFPDYLVSVLWGKYCFQVTPYQLSNLSFAVSSGIFQSLDNQKNLLIIFFDTFLSATQTNFCVCVFVIKHISSDKNGLKWLKCRQQDVTFYLLCKFSFCYYIDTWWNYSLVIICFLERFKFEINSM